MDSQPSIPSDEEFIRAMREEDTRTAQTVMAAVLVEQITRNAARIVCAGKEDMLYSDEANKVVDAVRVIAAHDGERVDMMKAIQLCLLAAWRFADGTVTGLTRLHTPGSGASSDDPITV